MRLVKRDLNGENPTFVSAGVLSADGSVVTLDFGPGGLGESGRSKADVIAGDGYYTLEIDLDGDGELETERSFYRLVGDANGDGTVDDSDIDLVHAAITGGVYVGDLDLDGDGRVNGRDLALALTHRERSLAPGLSIDD